MHSLLSLVLVIKVYHFVLFITPVFTVSQYTILKEDYLSLHHFLPLITTELKVYVIKHTIWRLRVHLLKHEIKHIELEKF